VEKVKVNYAVGEWVVYLEVLFTLYTHELCLSY
jgi:hypothetical protein